MFIRFNKFFVAAALLTFGAAHFVHAADKKFHIVATTTFNADLARKIGGDRVEVKSVALPKFNVHFIQPRPSDVKNLLKADLYVNSGLDLEVWSDPLVEAAGKPEFFRGGARSVDLSEGIPLLKIPTGSLSRALGDLHLFGNPHYHLSPENAKSMARTLTEKLKSFDPANVSYYQTNEKAFLAELDRRIASWKSLCAHCAGKEVFAYHDEVAYLADFLGLRSDKYLEPKPGIPPTPKHIQELENYAKAHEVEAILQTTYFPKDASEALAKRIGVSVVTIAHNIGEVSEASDIFSFYEYDVRQVAEALR